MRQDTEAENVRVNGDLGRTIQCVNDRRQSRLLGFHAYQPIPASFFDLFARLKSERIIPG